MIAAAALLVIAQLSSAPLQVRQPEWNQPYADPAASSSCDVEPVRATPAIAWTQSFDDLLAGPIVTQGTVYVVGVEKGARVLMAIRPTDGEVLARKRLETTDGFAALAGSAGIVAVVEPKQVRTYRLTGSLLSYGKKLEGSFTHILALIDMDLLVRVDPHQWTVLPLLGSGKALGTVHTGAGRVSFMSTAQGSAMAAGVDGFDDASNLQLRFDSCRWSVKSCESTRSNGWTSAHLPEANGQASTSVTVACASPDRWYVWFAKSSGASALCLSLKAIPVHFTAPPARSGNFLLGFDCQDKLIQLDTEALGYYELVQSNNLPKGAVRGAPSIARDVLYLGNWAVELSSGRVLWCLEGIKTVGPAIPAVDGVAVVETHDHRLLGLIDPAKASADLGLTAKAATSDSSKRPEPEAQTIPFPSEDPEAANKHGNDPRLVHEACLEALRRQHRKQLLEVFEKYAEVGLFDDCRRLLEEAQTFGLERDRAEVFAQRISGKLNTTASNAKLQRNKIMEQEDSGRQRVRQRATDEARWCADQSHPTAAAALLHASREFDPSRPVDAAIADPWIPAAFPWGGKPGVGAQWLEWASALLPSGACFVAHDDAARKRVARTAFETDGVALRTPNLLLFTRETDPGIVGQCLSRGEAAVALLDQLLKGGSGATDASPPLLEIRLHRTREEYLADRIGGQLPPMPWSSGVYSPGEGVSRFYARHAESQSDPLGRELHNVLAHELTHHYIDQRWARARSRKRSDPGIWLVEGFAEFVSEQAVETGRRGMVLDDVTVCSLDITSARARSQSLHPLRFLLELDSRGFYENLDRPATGPLQLRHHLKQLLVDDRALFYAQSAALTFFAMQRCGEDGRRGYLNLLQGYYMGKPHAEPWKELGFSDLEMLEAKFLEFLSRL